MGQMAVFPYIHYISTFISSCISVMDVAHATIEIPGAGATQRKGGRGPDLRTFNNWGFIPPENFGSEVGMYLHTGNDGIPRMGLWFQRVIVP